MEKSKILVTTYKQYDLDGLSCSFAYAELFRKKGLDATYAVTGPVHQEVRFFLEFFQLPDSPVLEDELAADQEIVLVDCSDAVWVGQAIDVTKITEVIDHRETVDQKCIEGFINAKLQIEPVGAAATLIAEKFMEENISPSKESAAMLFAGIISNTTNLQANVTTDRDRKAADWLLSFCDLPDNFVHLLFVAKSSFDMPLEKLCWYEKKETTFGERKVSIVQFELLRAMEFVDSHRQELATILTKMKIDLDVTDIFLTCIDLERAQNVFVVLEEKTEKLLSSAFDIEFLSGVAIREGIWLRKELWPMLKETIEEMN